MELNYIRCGDYFIPDLKLPEEKRHIGKWGRMHRDYLKESHPIQFNLLALSGNFHTYLADLDEQAHDRLEFIMEQMKIAECVTEELKAAEPMLWVQHLNSIRNRAEEIILRELIYEEALVRVFWKNFGMAISIRQNMMPVPVKNIRNCYS